MTAGAMAGAGAMPGAGGGGLGFPKPGPWQMAKVAEIRRETATAKTLRLELPTPVPFLAGQHFIIRLTAPDGYVAQRSYSVGSAPDGADGSMASGTVELTVERLPDGEVSSFLDDAVAVGDELEVRGPIGGFFVWRGDTPAVLVGGGSGVVPLMSMLRLARQLGRADLLRLVVSVRRPSDLYYASELPGPQTTVVYTRATPPGWPRPAGRLAAADLTDGLTALGPGANGFICGSARFADGATTALEEAGLLAGQIRVERFGPTG
ncbi:MAG TPA: FAD-binding oxidoreductase [Streptosporangiaceae bacterium]|nr:FAD-binding oxidoreductase [Streptosporangiaceae bacterium]